MSQSSSTAPQVAPASRIEHAFLPADPLPDPFAAPVWAILERPSGDADATELVSIPAYYDGGNTWRIRYRPELNGIHSVRSYTIGEEPSAAIELLAEPLDEGIFHCEGDLGRGLVRRSPKIVQRFVFDNGEPYFPIGYNVAWESPEGYGVHFELMRSVGLNWARVWMAHWAGMNLDWVMGKSVEPGELNLEVARRWDAVVEAAEENGIYFQLVLQHHGQFSTWINPNWGENPWNSANGGWLESPSQFFTDSRARELTKAKYRYIVARWGYSPAIMSWELFNEVELTDGYVERGLRELWELANRHGNFAPKLDTGTPTEYGEDDANVAHAERGVFGKLTETWSIMGGEIVSSLGPGTGQRRVAEWHHEMAAHIRSVDVTGRLVTTSSAPLGSLIWRDMDYYQSHLYHREMVKPLARIPGGIQNYDKPIFVGEMGDHEILDPAKSDGRYMAPMLWAGIFSSAAGAAQMWSWDVVVQHGLEDDLRSITRFLREAGFGERHYQVTNILAGGDDSVVALAMQSPDMCVIWLHDQESQNKDNPVELGTIVSFSPEIMARMISVRWYDTKAGQFVCESDIAESPDSVTGLHTPPYHGHIAAIISLRQLR